MTFRASGSAIAGVPRRSSERPEERIGGRQPWPPTSTPTGRALSRDGLDYHAAEGLHARSPRPKANGRRREWTMVATGLVGARGPPRRRPRVAFALAARGAGESDHGRQALRPPPRPRPPRRPRPRRWPTRRASRSRSSRKVDPTLPAVPAGAVKKFTRRRLPARHPGRPATSRRPRRGATRSTARPTAAPPPARRWSSTRATRCRSRSSTAARRRWPSTWPHSIDFHSAEVAPNKNYVDIAPGKS